MILDAGFLISVDRGERAAEEFLTAAVLHKTELHVSHPVIAQVWRGGPRQARLARFLPTVEIHPLDDGRRVGEILALSRTADVVDAHLVLLALRLAKPILTGDTHDLSMIIGALSGPKPTIFAWPPEQR